VLFVLALLLHRSEHGGVGGRWSSRFAVVVLVVAVGVAYLVYSSVRAAMRRERVRSAMPVASPAPWVDSAIMLFGAGYLLESVHNPGVAGRALDLELIGSLSPDAIVLEWLALVSLVVALTNFARRIRGSMSGPFLLVVTLIALYIALEGIARGVAIIDPEIEGFPTNRAIMWERRYAARNAAGFRDEEHSLTTAPGVRRLLIIGDSYAYGAGLDRVDQRFGERLGRALSNATGTRWEVISAARPDTHTRDHLQFLQQGLRYNPDAVLLLYVFNDIDYLSPITERTVLSEHPQSILDRLHPMRLAIRNSFLFQELYARWRLVKYLRGSAAPRRDPYADSALVATHVADLKAFVARASDSGRVAAIVPFDITIGDNPEMMARYSRFLSAVDRAHLPVWSLADAFRGRAFRPLAVNNLDGHPNAEANRLAAAAILPRLLEALSARAKVESTPPN
jgi:hypothetical protein